VREGVNGVSIGSNDLTQLILSVDRDSQVLAPLFNEQDPAVLGAIREIIAACRKLGITGSICGQPPLLTRTRPLPAKSSTAVSRWR
jgi:pyruvate, water dikinase